MTTTFGLELTVQLQPIFQVYITIGPQFRGQTRGEPHPAQEMLALALHMQGAPGVAT